MVLSPFINSTKFEFVYSTNEIAAFLKYLTPSPLVTLLFSRTFMNLADEHVAAISRAHSRTLECLDVSECSHISWNAVSTLLRDCPHLHSLDVGYCTQLTLANPKEVASTLRAASKRLRFLNMTSHLSISPAATSTVLEGLGALQNIRELRLCGSTKLTDEMVELVLSSFPVP